MSTGRPHHYGRLLQVQKESLQPLTLYTSFHDLINVYSHRWCQQKPLVTSVICYKFKKKSLWSLILNNFFHDFICVYSPGQEQTTPWGRNFDVNMNILSLPSFVASLKKNLFEVWFYTFFHDFIHVYGPRAGADSSQGTKFWCQQKCLVTPFILLQISK